jgi:hypothetical protein
LSVAERAGRNGDCWTCSVCCACQRKRDPRAREGKCRTYEHKSLHEDRSFDWWSDDSLRTHDHSTCSIDRSDSVFISPRSKVQHKQLGRSTRRIHLHRLGLLPIPPPSFDDGLGAVLAQQVEANRDAQLTLRALKHLRYIDRTRTTGPRGADSGKNDGHRWAASLPTDSTSARLARWMETSVGRAATNGCRRSCLPAHLRSSYPPIRRRGG